MPLSSTSGDSDIQSLHIQTCKLISQETMCTLLYFLFDVCQQTAWQRPSTTSPSLLTRALLT